jgi:hypothetical protein
MHKYIYFHHIHHLHPFLISSPLPLEPLPRRQDLFCLLFLCFFYLRYFCLFKIAIQVVSLWHFHVYMYYIPNRFIVSIFLLSTLVPFLKWFQQV